MPYTVLSHTADTGIEATAPTLEDLIAELAAGMFALMARPGETRPTREVVATVAARPNEDLVVDVLSELLYLAEVEDAILGGFEVVTGDDEVEVRATAFPMSQVDMLGPPVKAVTYHDLTVEQSADGWSGRVYFDV